MDKSPTIGYGETAHVRSFMPRDTLARVPARVHVVGQSKRQGCHREGRIGRPACDENRTATEKKVTCPEHVEIPINNARAQWGRFGAGSDGQNRLPCSATTPAQPPAQSQSTSDL
jgi:hypothetical protein